jgi:GPN-loop GTPase
MVKYVQIVIGPAGVGKSSYCKTMQEHGQATHRSIFVGNLDPAAEFFEYNASFDIRELIKVDEVMEDKGLGPNGALIYCMEYLLQNIEWLIDQLDGFADDDYIILDCPGQIELYSHLPIMRRLVNSLTMNGYRLASVYLLDALFALEPLKFISGCMLSLSCMLQLELPHINVITKCDIADKDAIDKILDAEGSWMIHSLDKSTTNPKLKSLSQAIGNVLDDYMLVSYATLDVSDEHSIDDVLGRVDYVLQYGEELEPKEPKDYDLDEDRFGDGNDGDGDGGLGGYENNYSEEY